MLLVQLSTGAQFSEAVVDLLDAIYGMPSQRLLLQPFAADQGRSANVRWAPLLSLVVPCFVPQTCPKGASGL
jgi:hypothetical protein